MGEPLDEERRSPPGREGALERVAGAFTGWAERWVPDAFIFALVATFVVILVASRRTPVFDVVILWGGGFWKLLEFTLQMALVIIIDSAIPRLWGVNIVSPCRIRPLKGRVGARSFGIAKAIP